MAYIKVGCTPKPNTHNPGVVYTACLPWKEELCWSSITEGVVQGFLREADETLLNDFANTTPSLRSTFPRQGPACTEAACLLGSLGTVLSDSSAFPLAPSKPTWTASAFPGYFRKKMIRSKPAIESEATFPITHMDKSGLCLLKPH